MAAEKGTVFRLHSANTPEIDSWVSSDEPKDINRAVSFRARPISGAGKVC